MKHLDFKGLNCPQPVIETKKYLDENPTTDQLCVVVDNRAAAENISRFFAHCGFEAVVTEKDREIAVTGTRIGGCAECESLVIQSQEKNTLVFISTNTLGTGDTILGAKLMLSFIKTLPEIKDSLWRLVFVNEGVKLTIENSETLPVLQRLEQEGVSILVCGTCLDFYQLLDQKQVGETTNMLDIMTSFQVAAKVITL